MNVVSISVFKARCLQLLAKVKATGQPLLVTRRGEPIARIEPPAPAVRPESWLGSARGEGEIVGEIVEPLGTGAWEVFEEGA